MGLKRFFKFIIVFGLLALSLTLYHTGTAPKSQNNQVLAQHEISLNTRYGDRFVNDVFKNNILLSLAYATGTVRSKSDINWQTLEKRVNYDFVLQPGEVFAFHDDILEEYKNKPTFTTNAHFSGSEGFLTDGHLYGDGVCHLASLINWTAKDAGLSVTAPTLHSFAEIPEIPAEYGVSIYASAGQKGAYPRQNLYIENKLGTPVKFAFNYQDGYLNLSILREERTYQ